MSHDNPSPSPAELPELLGGFVNGTLDDDGVRRLEAILLSQPESRAAYRRYMNLHAALIRTATTSRAVTLRRDLQSLLLNERGADRADEHHSGKHDGGEHGFGEKEAIQLSDSRDYSPASLSDAMILPAMKDELEDERSELMQRPAKLADAASRRWFSGRFRAAIIALPVMLGIGFTWILHQHHARPAALGACINATWEAPYQTLARGDAMPTGPIHLLSGLAEVRFQNGVSVVLQAPAQFEVRTQSLGELTAGKLTAMVPKGGEGFTVQTPSARIVDLGTEFGVEVTSDQRTHAEVFRGHVRAEAISATGDAPPARILEVNQAAIISRGDSSIPVTAPTPLAFVRIAELQRQAQSGPSAAERWLVCSDALRHDPGIVAYYTFDNSEEVADRLLNRAAGTSGQFDGRLGDDQAGHDPHWSTGRWAGKGALDFDASRRTCVTLPPIPAFENSPTITVAAWIMPRDPSRTMHILDEARGARKRLDFVWVGAHAVFPPYGIYFDRGGGAKNVPGILPKESRWTFLVVTADADGMMRFYVDGQERAAMPGAPRTGSPLALVIGRPALDFPEIRAQVLDGSIDEFALFNRVLSAEEIQAVYNAGKPESERSSGSK